MTHAQILGYALAAGWTRSNANQITVIAHYESGDDPTNVGDQTLSRYGSIGLTQDFTGAHTPTELQVGSGPWTPALVEKLKDPLTNMRAALIIFHEQGFSAWSTYNHSRTTAGWAALLRTVEALPDPGAPVPVPHPAPKPTGHGGALTADAPPNVHPLAAEAIVYANAHSTWGSNLCLQFVRTALRQAAKYRTAQAQWVAAPGTSRHTWYIPPVGVPVHFATRGSAGHVALSAGGLRVYSTDMNAAGHYAPGHVSLVTIAQVEKAMGATYEGWLDTCEDVNVYRY